MRHPPYMQEEHEALRNMLRRFVKNDIEPAVEAWEEAGMFPRQLLRTMGQLGLVGLSIPEDVGGQGSDDFSVIVLAEELARSGAAGFVMGLMVQTELATAPIVQLGTPEQIDRYVKPALAGEKWAAYSVDVPGAALPLQAVLDGDDWVISGKKALVPNGSLADFIVFSARTTDSSGREGWTLFVTELDRPGIHVSGRRTWAGMRTMDAADVEFHQLRLTPENVLGAAGGGTETVERVWLRESLIRAAICLGLAEYAYERAREYVQERKAFQRPLAQFQALSHRLAEMAVEMEAAKQIVYTATYRFVQGQPGSMVAMARLSSAQTAHWVADRALQLFGGYGYMMEYPIQRVWRDTRWFRMSGGTDEQWKALIGEQLLR